MNLRSHSTPIHVLLINRETSCSRPVVFSVPPPDDVCAMPTPPSTPASLQKYPITSESCGLGHNQLKSPVPEHQLTPLSTPPDVHMGNSLLHRCFGHLYILTYSKIQFLKQCRILKSDWLEDVYYLFYDDITKTGIVPAITQTNNIVCAHYLRQAGYVLVVCLSVGRIAPNLPHTGQGRTH